MADKPQTQVSLRHRLARQLEARRVELGKTRQDVEREGPVAAGSVSRFEAAERIPSIETLMLLCAPLRCTFLVAEGDVLLIPHREGDA